MSEPLPEEVSFAFICHMCGTNVCLGANTPEIQCGCGWTYRLTSHGYEGIITRDLKELRDLADALMQLHRREGVLWHMVNDAE